MHRTGTKFLQNEIFSKMSNVYSNENLSCSPFNRFSGLNINRLILLDLIKKMFGDVKIIVCFREKDCWLHSIYYHNVEGYGFYKSFDFWFDNYFNKDLLDFDFYKKQLKENFSDVFIYDFEDFVNHHFTVLGDMMDFIGVHVDYSFKKYNASTTKTRLNVIRFLNFLKEGVRRC